MNNNNNEIPNRNYLDKKETPLRTMIDDYRVALVDKNTLRYIGTQGKVPVLLGSRTEPGSKPFIMKSKFVFLPRIGEKISLPNHPHILTVLDVVHEINYSRAIPPYHLLFVNFSNPENE